MAKAPTPGRARADEAAKATLKLTLDGRTLEFQPAALTLKERFVIRQATGFPIESLLGQIGEESIATLWWCARRQNGEPNLPFAQVEAEWTGLNEDGFDLDIVEDGGEDDNPEG